MSQKPYTLGVSIIIYSEKGAKHKKPHVHAIYCEHEASIDLSGNVLAGKLPNKQLKSVVKWIKSHQHYLYTRWYKKNPLN